jgi:hypothetical protein
MYDEEGARKTQISIPWKSLAFKIESTTQIDHQKNLLL